MRAYNNLCADIGYMSLNHAGEQLCGDHIEIAGQDGGSTVIVLADGLGSGVKANILSTITSKIISTMLAAGLNLTDCVETIAATLPVCGERGIAYSTFTILRLVGNERAEIIQYDNPPVILLREGTCVELPSVSLTVGGKRIVRTDVALRENDVFIAMSDGVEHAGVGGVYNFGWRREDIVRYMETLWHVGFTAKTLTTILLQETDRLYDGKPGDDATVCTVRIRTRVPMNLLCGPPANRDDNEKMMSLFFGKEGKHIVCGGTTSAIAAEYLGQSLQADLDFPDPDIPPTARIAGVDLVTEGVVTINRVLEYAKNYLADNSGYARWSVGKDGASRIARLLFEEATDINFFVGCAVNPAHQNPDLPISFSLKMRLVEELSDCLARMGKRIKTSYF
ncbi:MAG: SpoIIE family protein phosphatase [Clostridiales bacterium]|nr:SpoIIE family protein phosphatase [Clostridiales bacterium]